MPERAPSDSTLHACHETSICSGTLAEPYSSTLALPSLTANSEGVTVKEAKGAVCTVGTPWVSSQIAPQLWWPLESVNLCFTEL